MRKIELDQGSDKWLEWRKSVLTATDCPMLLGVSPYATPYQCWQRKTGKIPEQVETEPMRRGKRDEPIARQWFNEKYGLDMQPICIESEIHTFLGASLDGLSKCGKYLLEIKSNGAQYHFDLDNGIPEFHYFQIQHQIISSDNQVEKGFYLSWHNKDAIVKEIKRDEEFYIDYLPKAKKFFEHVIFDNPPTLTNKDYKDMNEVDPWNSFAKQYIKLCKEIKNLEEIKESYRKDLIKLCKDQSCMGSGVKVLKKHIKGRVDYKELCENLIISQDTFNQYRKKDSYVWTIMLDEKD